MFNPPPDTPSDRPSKQDSGGQNWTVLILLWLFAASPIGLCFGYLPPRFKPRWLYHGVLSSIFAVWIALGIVQLIFNGQDLAGVSVGVIAILVGLGGLLFVLAQAGTSDSD